ncbi:MAG TPA: tetratricopeptide repeat protein [Candidatus Atribacteria bacterium]|nr:tetratricopeptide repeat protein [Candidatus Atribacteria bacterium]
MKMKLLVIWIFVIFFVLSSQSTFSMTQTPSSPINEADLTEEKASSVPSYDESLQADVNDSLSCFDFQFTCEYGTPEEVQEAVKNGADINCQDEELGWTPLMSAMLNESGQEIVTLLVGAGANVNVTSWSGINALMLAAESSESSLVKYLLDNGAKEYINDTESEYGFTPLIWAAKNNDTNGGEVIQVLIDHGADVSIKDKNGFTAILYAAMLNGNEDVIRTLIQNGVDINQIGPKNVTPLMGAISMNSNINITKLLLDSGADVSVISEEGKKAIDYALELERFKGTEILRQLAEMSGVEIAQPMVSPDIETAPSPNVEITTTPLPTGIITPEITPTPVPTQALPSMVYADPSGKFTLNFPTGFVFSTYVADRGMIGANYRTPNEKAYLEVRSFPSSQDLQLYLSQHIKDMALRGESSITSNGKTGNIRIYSRKTEQDELLTIVTTYQEIDVALVVINLPIAAYQPSSPWLLGLFKGINWEGKTPIIDGSYSDPDQKFSFKLPDGVHFLYAFEKDFYFNQPYRFLPEADGMVGSTPDSGQVMIASFSTPEKYQDYLKEYDRRVETMEYQVHGTSQFGVQGSPAKLTLYSYLAQNQKRAELLAVYEGTLVVISVWLPADNYQSAQTWLLSLFKNLTWKKEETLPSFSPLAQPTPTSQITVTTQPTESLQPTTSPQISSDDLSIEAAVHIEKGDFQKAIDLLKQSIALQPDFGFAYGQLAYCYIQLKLYQEVIDQLSDKLLPKKEYSTAYNLVGFAYENLARLDEALVAYQKAVELDPNYVDAYSNMGFVHFDREQYQKAVDAFKKASELKPSDPVIFNNLGFSYEKLGQYNEALQAYQEAIRIKPDYIKAHANIGYLYFDQEQYQKAVDALKKSLELEPSDPAILNTLGLSYENLKQYDDAIHAYQEAISIKPDYVNAYNNLGNLFFDLSQYQNALDSYKKSLVLESTNPNNYYNLGLCYENLKQHDDAIHAYQEAISIKPDYINAHTNLGVLYYKQDQSEKAIEEYKKSLELKPDNPNIHYNLGLAYEDLEQYENAIQAFQESNRIKPDDYDTYNSLGRVYNLMEKYQEALELLQKSIELNPENHYAHYNLGLAYEGLEQYENAIKAYQEAIHIKPDYIYAYNDLGYVYYYLDRNQEAVEILQKAININPEAATPNYYLGITYLQMGDKASATKQYEILKKIDQSLAEKLLNKINQ